MSDHPVEAFEPPYYVAVFSTVRTGEQGGYSETNARMEELVENIPGYLGMDHAQRLAVGSRYSTSQVQQLRKAGDVIAVSVRKRHHVRLMDLAFQQRGRTISSVEEYMMSFVEDECGNKRRGKDDQSGRIHSRLAFSSAILQS